MADPLKNRKAKMEENKDKMDCFAKVREWNKEWNDSHKRLITEDSVSYSSEQLKHLAEQGKRNKACFEGR